MADTYTVKKGDTLTKIASANNTTVANLVALNNISDPNYIVVGQVLKLTGTASTTKVKDTTKVTIDVFGLQSDTDRTVYVHWLWPEAKQKQTEYYETWWYYDSGDGMWFLATQDKDEHNQCKSLYNAPANAKRVMFKVIPVAKKRKVNGKEVAYWTAQWSTAQTYDFDDNPPTTPPSPTLLEIKDYTLTVEYADLDLNANHLEIQVIKDNKTVFKTGTPTIKLVSGSGSTEEDASYYVRYSCIVDAGAEYCVRARSVRDNKYSEWSEYSSNVGTQPSVPTGITTIKATSEKSVYLEWATVNNAETYDIQYTTEQRYFEGSDGLQEQTGVEFNHFEFTGLEPGDEYFFRVRAVNEHGESGWSDIKSIAIGKKPSPPTTWSSTTTVIIGDPLNLYWVHNAEDNSSQTYAKLEITVNGNTVTETIKNDRPEDEKDKTSVYSIDTKSFTAGTEILWRVQTSGATGEYGDFSIQRKVTVYARPSLALTLRDKDENVTNIFRSFPLYISALPGPPEQTPIGYHVVITSNEAYETVDEIGRVDIVKKGGEVYSKYFDTSYSLLLELSAGHINLENNVRYTVTCTVTMNSGLTAEATSSFIVSWTDDMYSPNAEIAVDPESLVAHIRPFCNDENDIPIEGITLSVYRREFDGSFTEIGTGLDNLRSTFVTDPHPSLDYARYRIVAITESTGAVSYYDAPGYPVGEKAIIIQWDEEWSAFDTTNEEALAERPWTGSFLRLPYNIDVSDKYSADVALIEYIGRKHPVGYYGTQIGETATWNAEIPKSDVETLHALRRLARWMGNVYVREPSGSGYWANINVSFSQRHCELTIPVTFDITRVEGDM